MTSTKSIPGVGLKAGAKSPWWILLMSMALAGFACDPTKEAAQDKDQTQNPPPVAVADTTLPKLSFPSDSGPVPTFDANRAMQYVKEIVALGPRPIGSANHKKVEDYITSHLKGDTVDDDAFTADTVEGKFPVRNIIAKFPGNKDGIIVIASHYDTNYPLRETSFIGANDGAATSALLLEFATQLRSKKREGYSVWLLWTDAEEAMKSWSDSDSVYGTRHLAQKWQQDGTAKQIKAFLLADMIGDADLDIDRDTNSTPWVESVVYEAATEAWATSRTSSPATTQSQMIICPLRASEFPAPTSSTSITDTTTCFTIRPKTRSTSSAPRAWKSAGV